MLITFLYFVISIIFAITIHEFAHAYAAFLLGDPTAKNQERLTLNPLKHLDFYGTLFILMFQVGWGKPVPVNSHNFTNPKFHSILVALAGPLSNLITVLLAITIHKYIFPIPLLFLQTFIHINLILFIFNLLPIPPLDGSTLLSLLIPSRHFQTYQNFLQNNLSLFIIVILADLLLFPRILGFSFLSNTIFFLTNALKTALYIGL